MALLEQEMIRFAEALDDYEHVSVADMGAWGPDGFWVVVTDERFGISYEIASHCDYWDLVSAFVRSVPAANSGGEERERLVTERTAGSLSSRCLHAYER